MIGWKLSNFGVLRKVGPFLKSTHKCFKLWILSIELLPTQGSCPEGWSSNGSLHVLPLSLFNRYKLPNSSWDDLSTSKLRSILQVSTYSVAGVRAITMPFKYCILTDIPHLVDGNVMEIWYMYVLETWYKWRPLPWSHWIPPHTVWLHKASRLSLRYVYVWSSAGRY